MAITKAFSSQGTTIEIFSNPTAQTALETAIANAMANNDTSLRLAALKSAYNTFFGATTSQQAIRVIKTSGATVTEASQSDGFFTGTWAKTIVTAVGTTVSLSGSFSSTGVKADGSEITAKFYLASGTPLTQNIRLDIGDLTFATNPSSKGTITANTTNTCVISGATLLSTASASSGKWYNTATNQGGTWSGTATSASAITPIFVLTNGGVVTGFTPTTAMMTFDAGVAGSFAGASFGAVATFATNQMITAGLVFPAVSSANTGGAIGKITAAGDTGKTYTMISEKLINEAGTYKGKGSVDEGDFTIDYLHIPTGDPGQDAMELAFEDTSSSANRVFRITHLSSSSDGTAANAEKVYFVGLVTELKKSRGTIDKIVPVKAKIAIQNGLVEDDPA